MESHTKIRSASLSLWHLLSCSLFMSYIWVVLVQPMWYIWNIWNIWRAHAFGTFNHIGRFWLFSFELSDWRLKDTRLGPWLFFDLLLCTTILKPQSNLYKPGISLSLSWILKTLSISLPYNFNTSSIHYNFIQTQLHLLQYTQNSFTMDSSSLNNMRQNIYIPSTGAKKADCIPLHHPTLIMQDYQTDTTHNLSCGCHNGACIEERAWWFNNSSASPRPLATKPSYSQRPVYKTSASSSSVSSISSF